MRKRRKTILTFVIGCFCGILIENLLQRHFEGVSDVDRFSTITKLDIQNNAIYNDMTMLYRRESEASSLSNKVKILCWVLTQENSLYTKAKAVKETWGKYCNVLLFISSKSDDKFPAISFNVKEGYENLWLKTKAAWFYVYQNHYQDADWFVKADDDTFMIVENLRHFLSKYKSSHDHYFGRNLWTKNLDYNSGGAGYVFSKETLRKFSAVVHDCTPGSNAEDIAVATCLKTLGIETDDTRDENGKETFHPFAPDFHLIPGAIERSNWLYKLNKWELSTGPDCCSEYSIAFHYTTPRRMYLFDYYLYVLKKGE